MKKLLVTLFVLCLTLGAFAQEAQKPQGPPPLQKPGTEMQQALKETSGRWKVAATFHKTDMNPQESTDTGTAIFHPIAGGMALVQEYRSDGKSPMGRFEGFEILWFDAKEKKFKTFWCDNMSPGTCMMSTSGNHEGDQLVMTGEMDYGGQKVQLRQVVKMESPTSMLYTEEANGQKSMTIRYTKVGDATHGHGAEAKGKKK